MCSRSLVWFLLVAFLSVAAAPGALAISESRCDGALVVAACVSKTDGREDGDSGVSCQNPNESETRGVEIAVVIVYAVAVARAQQHCSNDSGTLCWGEQAYAGGGVAPNYVLVGSFDDRCDGQRDCFYGAYVVRGQQQDRYWVFCAVDFPVDEVLARVP